MKQRTVAVGALLALIALFVSIGVAYGTPGSGAAACTRLAGRSAARLTR